MKITLFKKRKRIRELEFKLDTMRAEKNQLIDNTIKKIKIIVQLQESLTNLNAKYSRVVERKEKAQKHIISRNVTIKELERRRDEVIDRLKSKIPDEVIGGRFEDYKYWVAEPFIIEQYTRHTKVDDKTIFVDHFAAYREINRVLKEGGNLEDGEKEE